MDKHSLPRFTGFLPPAAKVSIAFVSMTAFFSVSVNAANPIPDYYEEPGFSSSRSYQNSQPTEFVDPFSGGLSLNYIDLVVPGNGGLDVVIRRTYRSLSGQAGVVGGSYLEGRTTTGIGWDIHFGRVWPNNPTGSNNTIGNSCKSGNVASINNPILELADGSRKILADASAGESDYDLISKDRWIGRCLNQSSGSGGLVVYSPEGYEYIFDYLNNISGGDDAYSVTKITDPNGNWMKIDYLHNGFNQYTIIEKITTSDGRLVTFSYDNDNPDNNTSLIGSTADALLRSINAYGRTVSYNYAALPGGSIGYKQLLEAVRPDGKKWTYQYHASGTGLHSLKKVTSPSGVNADYTYSTVDFRGISDYRTVLSSKNISGGGVTSGNWSYSYNPTSSYDETTIISPNGCEKYRHNGFKSSANNGTLWSIGNLINKQIFDSTNCGSPSLLQEEIYTWEPQVVSTQNQFERGAGNLPKVDTETNASLLSSKSITRDGTTYTSNFSNFDGYGNYRHLVETSGQGTRTSDFTYYLNTNQWIIQRKEAETIQGVGTINWGFDTKGNLINESRYGVNTTFTYHSTGDLASIKDARLKVTNYSNYFRGIPQTEYYPEGVTVTRDLDDFGNITRETNGRGKSTFYGYDDLSRLTSIDTPKNNDSNISISWTDSTTGISRIVSRGTFSETRQFDGLGRIKSSSAHGISVTTDYDAEGNKTFVSNPNGGFVGVTFQYDKLGRVTRVINQDSTDKVISYKTNNKVDITNERDYLTRYQYRSYGDPDERVLIEIQAPESVTTEINRNSIGLISSVVQGGLTRNYSYNTNYYLTSEINPETGTTTFGRDAVGNLISKKVGNSATSYFTYDGLNRLTLIDYPGTTPDTTYNYDNNGNVTSVLKGISSWAYLYDDNDNLLQEVLSIPSASKTFQIAYGYNDKDSLNSTTYPSGLIVDYAPDNLGRPTKVGNFVSSANYHPSGQMSSMTYGNGKTTLIDQSTRLFPSSVNVAGGGSTIVDLSYGYDGVGNIESITDSANTAQNRALSYDGLDRLVSATGQWGSGAVTYSPVGNITLKTIGTQSLNYAYGSNNQLSSITGTKPYSFTYDVYGNVASNGSHNFIYGDDQNLSQVSGSHSLSYTYDGNNQRTVMVKNGLTTYSVYDKLGRLIFEQESSGKESDYVYLKTQLIARRTK